MQLSYRNYNISIVPDEYPMNPRDNDNLGTMYCFHRRYDLGDKHDYKQGLFFADLQEIHDEKAIILPLYLLDHSGISISIKPFNCRFDSGQIGFIVCPTAKIISEYGNDEPTNRFKALKCLEAEVLEYNTYISGEYVFVKVTDSKDNEIFSAGSIYDEPEAISLSREMIDLEISHRFSKRLSLLKTYIKNHVPLNLREKLLAKGV
jgi:hypothetical protein